MSDEQLEKLRQANSRLHRILEHNSICSECGNVIDVDMCYCGLTRDSHEYEPHNFVPNGCRCGYGERFV